MKMTAIGSVCGTIFGALLSSLVAWCITAARQDPAMLQPVLAAIVVVAALIGAGLGLVFHHIIRDIEADDDLDLAIPDSEAD